VSGIELTAGFRARPIRHVLMDWDGTTALSRTGWAHLMLDIFLEHLPLSPEENDAERRAVAWAELMQLNGRPSIHQMARLAEMVRERGGNPASAQDYQGVFQQRLAEMVHARLQQIRLGDRAPHTLLLPGVGEFLAAVQQAGIRLTLASGTPLPQLREEAVLLGIAPYFDGRIFGPDDTHDTHFSKRAIIAAILQQEDLSGSELIAFGDGPVELAETKAVGGLAIAVASDEENPGQIDAGKRETLLAAGADAVIADFQDPAALLQAFFAAPPPAPN
jgi:phosphoglycolate phosphatase